jgi:hypothetical protein
MGGRFCIYCNMITHPGNSYCSGTRETVMGSSASDGQESYYVEDEWTYAYCNFVFEATYRNGFFEMFAICIRIQGTWIPGNCKFTVFYSVCKGKDFAFCHHIYIGSGKPNLKSSFLGVTKWLGVKMTIHLHLIPRLGMCGSSPDFILWHAAGISESEQPSISRQRLCNQVSCIIV